ncbi:hypothetical protein [Streptomyces sp. A012304]|nr:hypothetical protein [Streptomyces sp. A012304]
MLSNPDQTVLKALLDHFSANSEPAPEAISELTSLLAPGDARR